MMYEFALLQPQDLPSLHALRQLVLREPLGLNLFTEDLEKETDELKMGLILSTTKQLIASVQAVILDNNICKIRQMAVHPSYQNKGLGKLLLTQAHKYISINFDINTYVLHARETAIPFYKKMGYNTIGEQFLEVGLPHVKMKKK